MRKINLVVNMFLLTALLTGLSGCQKDPVQPTGASTHVTKVSSKTVSDNKPASSITSKEKTEPKKPAQAAESKKVSTKTRAKKTEEKPKIVVPKSPVKQKPQATTQTKTTASSTSTKTPTKPAPTTPVATVTVSIIGYNGEKIVGSAKVPYKSGETLLDATLYILKEKGIQSEVSGTGAAAYVKGINNEYEFDHGVKSGWTASKNGVKLTQSAGITSIKAGDRIEWRYTTTGE